MVGRELGLVVGGTCLRLAFVATMVGSVFSNDGVTFQPPYFPIVLGMGVSTKLIIGLPTRCKIQASINNFESKRLVTPALGKTSMNLMCHVAALFYPCLTWATALVL